jgi:hypothetical protein
MQHVIVVAAGHASASLSPPASALVIAPSYRPQHVIVVVAGHQPSLSLRGDATARPTRSGG